jgi:putative inorganic carbon (hco3(-)) transporter
MIADRQSSVLSVWTSLVFLLLAIGVGLVIGLLVFQVSSTFQIAAILVGSVILVLSLLRPELGLLVMVFITYTRFSDVLVHQHGFPSIAQPFIALLGVAVLFRWLMKGVLPGGWLRPALLVGLYGLVIFSSLFFGADFNRGLSALIAFFKDAFIAILVVILLQRKSTMRYTVWALLAAGIFMASLSVYQYLTKSFDNNFYGFAITRIQNIVGVVESNRIAGPIGDPNYYAMVLIPLLPLAFNRLWSEEKLWLRLLAVYALVVCTLTILFTFSRGGFIALVITYLLLFLYRGLRPSQLMAVILLIVIVSFFVPDTFFARLETLTSTNPTQINAELSLRSRLSAQVVAINMFIDHPILGVGYANYPVYSRQYAQRLKLGVYGASIEPHNLYLEIAAETGLVGLVVFGLLLFWVFIGLRRARAIYQRLGMKREAELALAYIFGLLGYLTAALFIHGAYPRFFWLLIGIAFAIYQVAMNENAVTSEARHGK